MKGKTLRKHATSIALLAAALGLGAYVWLVDWDRPTTSEIAEREDNLLPVLRRDEIRTITIESGDRSATIVRRDDADAGDFMFHFVLGDGNVEDAPYADQVAVERLIQALELAPRLRKIEGELDREAAGLQPPTRRLTLRMGSITYRITVGGEAKMPAGSRYVELESEGVFVIPRAQAQGMVEPIDTYRSRRVIPYTSTQLASLEIDSERGTTKLVRASWDGFRVENLPGKPRVSQPVFERMLGALGDATAERFLQAEQAREALAKAESKVTLVLVPKDGPRAELTLGGTCPEAAAGHLASAKLVVLARKSPNPLYACVPSTVLSDLQTPAAAFAERRAFVASPDQVESIEVQRDDATLELIRKGSGWHVRKPEDRQIPADDVEGFLFGLLSIEGTIVDAPDAAKLGLDPPRGTVTLRHPSLGERERPPQVVEVGAETKADSGPALALRRKLDGVVLLVPATADRLLQPSTTLIRSTELLSINAMRIQRIEVTRSDGLRQVVSRKGAGFEMQEPKGYEVDAPLAADLFDALSRLKAERWVADQDDGSFGLEEPSMRVAFTFADKKSDEQQERVLLLGGQTVEGRYGRWGDDTGVFVVPRSLVRVLGTWVVDRSGFMIDPNEVQALKLVSKGRELHIVAKGDAWQTAGTSAVQLPAHALARIRQKLIDMRAEGIVHLGAAEPSEGMSDPVLRISMTPRPEARNRKVDITIGRADVWENMNVYYARKKGTNATFAIARSKVRPILELIAPQ